MLIINVPTQSPELPELSITIIPATNEFIAVGGRLIVTVKLSYMFPQRLSVVKLQRITPSPVARTWGTVQVRDITFDILVNWPD